MELATPASEPAPPSLVAANGDQCVACAAPLAPDQRYCLNCGERRGAARLPLADTRSKPAPAEQPPRRRRPGTTTGTALIAGIATLLLAMGVGVLIGRQGKTTTAKATPAAVQVVTVPGAGASAAASTPTTTTPTATASTASRHSSSSKHHRSSHASTSSKAPAKAAPPATVKVGTPGHGKGYKNGKFTGDFFGQ